MKKKFLAILLTLIMVFQIAAPALTVAETTVDGGGWPMVMGEFILRDGDTEEELTHWKSDDFGSSYYYVATLEVDDTLTLYCEYAEDVGDELTPAASLSLSINDGFSDPSDAVTIDGSTITAKKTGQVLIGVSPDSSDAITYLAITVTAPEPQNFYRDAQDATLYHIANLEGLKEFRNSVNSGTDYLGKTIRVDQNLEFDLAGSSWVPIGGNNKNAGNSGADRSTPFRGTFDGNGLTVRNLTISDNTMDYAGLFGFMTDATLKNINIVNVNISARNAIGAIVGGTQALTAIENCTVTGTIRLSGNHYVGGISGWSYAKTTNCTVNGGSAASSLIHAADMTAEPGDGDDVGGILGFAGEGSVEISGCAVSNVTIEGFRQVGGIAGIARVGRSVQSNTVSNVTIRCIADDYTVSNKAKKMAFGGIVGVLDGGNSNGTVTVKDNTVTNVSLQSTDTGKAKARMGFVTGGLYDKSSFEIPADTTHIGSNNVVTDCTRVAGTLAPVTDHILIDGLVLTSVAQIGSVKYTTLAEAVAAAEDGDTITMTANSVEQDSIVISGKSVTVDLNGKTVSFAPVGTGSYWGPTKTWFTVNSGAGLSIIDSATEKGQLTVDPEFTCTITFMSNRGTVNLGTDTSNGPVISMKVTTYQQAVDTDAYATTCSTNRAGVSGISNYGTINVKYAVMYLLSAGSSSLTGITTQKNATANIDHATFNITNGTTGLSSYNGSNSTIQNCSFVIHEEGTGIATNGAGASIADCTVTMSGTELMSASSAYGIRVNKSATASTEPDVEISNLTLTADYSGYGVTGIDVKAGHVVINSADVSIVNDNGDALVFGASALAGFENKAQLEVKGGFYSGDLSFWGKGTAVITGGTFTSDPSAYVADGYEVIEEDGCYWVTLPKVAKLTTYDEEMGRYLKMYYPSLEEALTYVHSDGDVVTLRKDVTIDKKITIDNGKSFTLDLGGHTLTCTGGRTFDLQHTFMTVQNGTLTGSSQPFNVYASESSAYATGKYNTLTLKNNVTVNGSYAVILWYPKSGDPAYGTHIVIDGATLNGNVWVLGTIAEGNSVIDINSGTKITVESADKDAVGVALQGYATVNIEAGVVISAPTGIEVAGGTLNVTGGSITGTAKPTSVEANNNGTTTEGAGIAVAPYGYTVPRVNISGGKINGYTALNIANPRSMNPLPVISVTGGEFTATNEGTYAVHSTIPSVTGFISGGLYSTEPAAAYIATGYEAKAATSPEGYYEIVKASGTAVNTNNDTVQYNTVEAGISAVVTNDTVDSITTSAAATVGSVTIAKDGTVAVAANGDSGVKASGTTVVTATEVAITKGSESTAYAITKTNDNQVEGSTLATATLGNGMNSNANPSVYVKDVADKLADAVLNSSATVDADLEVDLKLDVVADQTDVSGNTVTYDVSLQGVFTVNGSAGTPVEIPNSDLATGASFTFKVKAPEGAKLVNVVHRWTSDSTYDAGSETFENLVVDANGYVEITLTHFSEIDVTGLTQYNGDNKDVNSVYRVYMNLQDGLYLTYQIYVGDSATTTVELSNGGGTGYTFNLSSATSFNDVQSAAFNKAMREDVVNNGYFIARYQETPWYYITVSNYPNYMDNAVTLKLTDGNETRALYQNGGTTEGISHSGTVLYSTQNDVFSYTMLAFLNSTKNSSDAKTRALSEVLISYYEAAYAQYGH